MRKFLLALFLAVTLTGCAGGFPSLVVTDPATVTTPVQVANASINQGYATHAAVTMTLSQNYKDGVITKDEKNAYAERTRQALDYLDTADDLMAAGNVSGANANVALAKVIFSAVQTELAKQIVKEKENK